MKRCPQASLGKKLELKSSAPMPIAPTVFSFVNIHAILKHNWEMRFVFFAGPVVTGCHSILPSISGMNAPHGHA